MDTITITLNHFTELVKKAERIEAVKRMFDREDYVSAEDIQAVLNIEVEKEKDNETV